MLIGRRFSVPLWLLQATEPERAANAIEAGHPGVVKALAEYYKTNR